MRLPGGIEPFAYLRTYYYDQTSMSGGAPSTAWALGGWIGARSPWWGDVFQAAVNFYTSQRLYGPAGEGGTKLLQPDQAAINVLGEAFGALRFAGQTFTAYRQLIDRPFISPQDNRMVPNTFEAYTLSGTVADVTYTGGYVTKEKVRDSESFVWMSNVAGGTGRQAGVAFAGATYAPAGGVRVRADEQYGIDTFNTFYADIAWPLRLAEHTLLTLGGQFFPQDAVGAKQVGDFSTWGYGLTADVAHGPYGLQVSWTQTSTGGDTQNPVGSHPSYLNLLQVSFTSAGERAWGVTGTLDCADWGAPGLTADVAYAQGRSRTSATGPLPNHSEVDASVYYAIAKGSPLAGLSAAFRYSWLMQDGAPQTATQLRAYVSYAVPF
jgi:hypothetical protein